jgi:2-oxoglutarate dehydrogenase dihydrolipoamide succinyltransferase (E2 component)
MSSSPTDQSASSASRPGSAESLVEVAMPQMGVSVAEGTIVEWRKHPGDWVEADEPVCDVTTDKIDVEIPSPAAGRIERILVEPGETVAVGTPLAEIDAAASPGEAHPAESAERSPGAATPEQTAEAQQPEPAETGAEGAANGEPDRSSFHSPVVRRIADKHGVDLAKVEGTGIGGRVRKRDVLAYIEAGGAAEPRPPAEPEPAAEPVLHTESPYRPDEVPAPAGDGSKVEAPDTGAAPAVLPSERREPMSPMRTQIARHMVESRRTAAHCTTIVEVDLSRVVERRAQLKEAMKRRGVPLTYLAFVARATVTALQEYAILNASIDGDEIVHHDQVNLGIAVALDDGLIVPVIRSAERLSLEGLAAGIGDVAGRARSGELKPDDVHGGTFTITNPGQFGAVLATPIINQPQVAILDLEAVVKRPVVVSGPQGDSIAIRPMTYLCMSWDHRALDGAVAARFLGRIKELLEEGDL